MFLYQIPRKTLNSQMPMIKKLPINVCYYHPRKHLELLQIFILILVYGRGHVRRIVLGIPLQRWNR